MKFYRVQHANSFTVYRPAFGLEARGVPNYIDREETFNARTFYRHLQWRTRSAPFSPFISLYNNVGKTRHKQGGPNVMGDDNF
jgi:hypothetical protein